MCLLIEVAVYGVLAILGLQLVGVVTDTSFDWWVILLVGVAAWALVHGLFAVLARRRW